MFGWTAGGLTLLWALVWFFVAHDVPADHPRISRPELEYLTAVVPHSSIRKVNNSKKLFWNNLQTSSCFFRIISD